MKRTTIEVSEATAALLAELANRCTEIDRERDGATTHGKLTIAGLVAMLAEDAAMVVSRPGSWEGSNMHSVLTSHGYEI